MSSEQAVIIIVENIQYSNQTVSDLIKNHPQCLLLKITTKIFVILRLNVSIKDGGTYEKYKYIDISWPYSQDKVLVSYI